MDEEYLSKFVTFKEGYDSPTAKQMGIDNTPPAELVKNMRSTAIKVFDPTRSRFGVPIGVNSFYRSKRLNDAVGSTDASDHRYGFAIDMDIEKYPEGKEKYTNAEMFLWMCDHLEFSQIIWEMGTDLNPKWVHVAYNVNNLRNKKITIARPGQGYKPFDLDVAKLKQYYKNLRS